MHKSIPSTPTFPSPPRAFVILSVPAGGKICQKTSARGWDICQFFQKWFISFLFQYFTWKYAYLDRHLQYIAILIFVQRFLSPQGDF